VRTAEPGKVRQQSPQGQALEADRALLGRTSTAERVADVLRTRITEGFFPPRTPSEVVSGYPATPSARHSSCSPMSGCSPTNSTAGCSSGC
jgi:hypothetical protein